MTKPKLRDISLLALLAFPLAACDTTSGVTQTAAVIAEVQKQAKAICQFVPTIKTVSQILAVFGVPGIGAASDVASQICAALAVNPMAEGDTPGRTPVKVLGVTVHGKDLTTGLKR